MEAKLQVLDASKVEDERLLRDEHAAELANAEARCTQFSSEFDAQRMELQAAEAIEKDLVEATCELQGAKAQLQEARADAESTAARHQLLEAEVEAARSE